MAELSTIELAEKQRHLNLLVKIKEGKALTAGEMKELKKYEEQMTKKKKKPAKKKKKKAVKKKFSPKRGKLTAAKIKKIALDSKDIVHAKADNPGLANALKKKETCRPGREAVSCSS